MDRLQERVDLLRWLLPVTAFIVVLLHQILEHTWLHRLPTSQHFATQVVFYGLAGPLVVWVMFTWIADSVAARERAMDQLATLRDFSRRLATTPDEHLLDTIVRFPAEILDAVGCSLMLFHDRSNVASVEATWGLSQEYADALHSQVNAETAYMRCHGCKALRATRADKCPALPSELTRAEDVQSVICVPLGRGDEIIGRLNVYLPSAEFPAKDKMHLLNAMAAEAAPAIEASQLRSRELSTLYHVDQTIRRRLGNLDGLLRQILQESLEACEAEGGAILLCREPDGSLDVRAAIPDSFSVGDTRALAALVAQRTAPFHIVDLDVPENVAGRTRVIGVPMTVDHELLGVLYMTHVGTQGLSERQARLLSAIASQTGLIVQNARFYAQLESHAILTERARLAREMHDGLAQGLGYLNLKTQHALRRLQQERAGDAAAELAEIQAVVQDLYAEVRGAIDGLRQTCVSDGQFASSLADYIEKISRRSHIPMRLEMDDPTIELPPTTAAQVLRIVQEGLNNVVKHAGATQAEVKIQKSRAGLDVIIDDDGHGFDPDGLSQVQRNPGLTHLGLQIMRERARALGGRLDIQSDARLGTTIMLHLPQGVLRPSAPEADEVSTRR